MLSPRELACHITDTQAYFISESSAYRILKAFDLVTSPAFILLKASDKFRHPTRRVNELWQTNFTRFKVTGWGYYYLSTVIDDFSRYILAWKLSTGMAHTDVQETLDRALAATGVTQVALKHRPRLLSDNGPAHLSAELADYLQSRGLRHTRGQPFHPMTQGKIERYHCSLRTSSVWKTTTFPGSWSRPLQPLWSTTTIGATTLGQPAREMSAPLGGCGCVPSSRLPEVSHVTTLPAKAGSFSG